MTRWLKGFESENGLKWISAVFRRMFATETQIYNLIAPPEWAENGF